MYTDANSVPSPVARSIRASFFSSSRCLGNKTVRRTQAKNKQKGNRSSRSRQWCACRVALRRVACMCTRRRAAADWRARRARSCGATNGGGSRDAPRARTRLFTNNNNTAGGAASTQRGRLRATSYAQLSLHLAGFDSEHIRSKLRSVYLELSCRLYIDPYATLHPAFVFLTIIIYAYGNSNNITLYILCRLRKYSDFIWLLNILKRVLYFTNPTIWMTQKIANFLKGYYNY